MTVTLVVFYGLSFNSGAVEAISVTPGYFWPPHFWIWTAFTHWDDAQTVDSSAVAMSETCSSRSLLIVYTPIAYLADNRALISVFYLPIRHLEGFGTPDRALSPR